VAERGFCLGCPVDVDVHSDELKGPLAVSITKYNGMSNASHLFMFNSLAYATRQVQRERERERERDTNTNTNTPSTPFLFNLYLLLIIELKKT